MRNRRLVGLLLLALIVACAPDRPAPARKNDPTPPAQTVVQRTTAPAPVSTLLAADLDSALALQNEWRHEAALEVLENAIRREADRPEATTDTVLALVYHKAGISRYVLDQPEAAIEYFQRALEIRERVFPPEHPDVIRGYNNLGNVYNLIGEQDKALSFLMRSLELQPSPPIDPYPATALALGRIYGDQNDAYRAEKYLELSLAAYKRLRPDDPRRIADAYTDLAYFYIQNERYETSLDASRQALQIQLSLPEKQDRDAGRIANAYTNLSVAFENLRQLDSAMYYQDQSLRWSKTLYPDGHPQLAINYNNIGYLHFLQKDYPAARAALDKAIRINRQNDQLQALADNLENLGNIDLAQGLYDQAMSRYHEALRQLSPRLPAEPPTVIPAVRETVVEPLRVMNNLYLKGKALRSRFVANGDLADLQLARQHFDTLSLLADNLRFSYLSDDAKINLARQTKTFFEEAIRTDLDLYAQTAGQGYAEHAFQLAEKSKAIVLLEALKETRARHFAGLEEADLKRERSLKEQIARLEMDIYQKQLQEDAESEQVQKWKQELIDARTAYEQLIAQLEEKSPDYYRLKYDNRALSVADIQQDPNLLRTDQALLEFFVGEEAIYAFLVDRRQFAVHTLPLDFSLAEAVDAFRRDIDRYPQDPEGALASYLEHGQTLYRKIWAPVADAAPREVIVVPDDVLGLLPFEALLTGPVDPDQPLRSWPYLIKTHQISYNYSAALLQEALERPALAPVRNEVLAFAPSFAQKIQRPPSPGETHNPIAENARAVDVRRGLQPLFFNEEEVNRIGRIVAAQIYAGEKANKQTFRELAPRYRFLHIATHGLADNEEPDYSFVAFSQPADTIVLDEVLLVNELYNFPLNADMIVLSACETGVGKIQRGEGIVSLARGFSYAGARSIITTLWNISDQRSNNLMQSFYQQLRQGATKDAALRQAKMAFVDQNGQLAHPYFWAGFVPLGDMSAVEMAKPHGSLGFPQWTLIMVLAVGMGGLLFWRGKLRG